MATSPALISAIANSTGETPSTVGVALRRLREAKLVAVVGRGPYAVKMTSRDAARLVIAICGAAPLEKDSARLAVGRFEPLAFAGVEKTGSTDEELEERGLSLPFANLTESDDFGDCLVHLLETAVPEHWSHGFTLVKFFLPVPAAVIERQSGAYAKRRWAFGQREALEDLRYLSIVRERGLGQKSSVVTIDEHVLAEVGVAIK